MAGRIISKVSGENSSFYGLSAEPIFFIMEKEAESWEQMSAIPKLFNRHNSESFAEKLTSKTSMRGPMPVGEGGAYPKDDFREGYSKSLYHETFKDQFSITREMAKDNITLKIDSEATGFTSGFYRGQEDFAAAIIGNGGSTSFNWRGKSFKSDSADGVALFSTAHTSITGEYTNQSNAFSDAFSVDALSAVETAMQDFRDDNGVVLNISPDTIVIPNLYDLKRDVFAAIGADKDPATANNGSNFQFGRWNVIVWPYLNTYIGSGNKPWFLLDSRYNNTAKGLVWFDREKLEVTPWIDRNNDNYVWNGYARWSAGANNWRAICRAGISGGTTLINA